MPNCNIFKTAKFNNHQYFSFYSMHSVWFFIRDGFFSTQVSESHPPKLIVPRVGFEWWEIHLSWKTIQNVFSRLLYTSRHVNHDNALSKVEDHENHVGWIYLTTVLDMGDSQKYAHNYHSYYLTPSSYE